MGGGAQEVSAAAAATATAAWGAMLRLGSDAFTPAQDVSAIRAHFRARGEAVLAAEGDGVAY
eukprot:SAG25_NODE_2166_length_1881_cov_2.393939_1_plen_62_part_00